MNARHCWVAIIAAGTAASAAYALVAPSASDGPVKLLSCVVTPAGVLEASVDNQSDDAMSCDIRCSYELGGRTFSHDFSLSIPAKYQGRVGQFDTGNAKAGNYPGEIGRCQKVER
jgi:hypothetical protein